jgi:hypothetical protein
MGERVKYIFPPEIIHLESKFGKSNKNWKEFHLGGKGCLLTKTSWKLI